MGLSTRKLTVTTTTTRHVSYSQRRSNLAIRNAGTAAIYIGHDPGLSTDNGFEIPVGQTIALNFLNGDDPREELYMVSSASQTVYVLETFRPFDLDDEGYKAQNGGA